METGRFDVVVIGAGPAGRRAALECARRGRRVAVVERAGSRDGLRLNAGTITSKTLRAAIAQTAGLGPRAPMHGALGRREMAIARLAGPVNRLLEQEQEATRTELEAAGVRLLQGTARFSGPRALAVAPDGTGGGAVEIEALDVVIACGSRGVRPTEVDFDGQTVVDAAGVLGLSEAPVTLVVVGAGLVGLEYASMFAVLGTHVTVVEARTAFASFLDEDVARALRRALAEHHVTLRLGEPATEVARQADGTALTYLAGGGWIQSRAVIWAGERRGAVDDLNLAAAGLEADDRGCLAVDDAGRTSQPHVYAAGDVSGLPTLASVADWQGLRAALAICDVPVPKDAQALALGLWTVPELASVGATAPELAAQGDEPVTGVGRFEDTVRGRIDGGPEGFVKLVAQAATGSIAGVHVFGTGAAELVHIGATLLRFDAALDDVAEMTYVYPTLSDAYRIAAMDALSRLR
jgi:NAD(P) transhydrogenase